MRLRLLHTISLLKTVPIVENALNRFGQVKVPRIEAFIPASERAHESQPKLTSYTDHALSGDTWKITLESNIVQLTLDYADTTSILPLPSRTHRDRSSDSQGNIAVKMTRDDKAIEITTSGKDYLNPATNLIAKSFTDDPVLKFLLCDLSEEDRLAYLSQYMYSLLKAASLNDAAFQEANDWSCCAVWMPPGKRVDNPWTVFQAGLFGILWKLGLGGCKRMFLDVEAQTNGARRKGLRDAYGNPIKECYYLFFIATDLHARGQGIASHVVRQWQHKAAREGHAIWMEATTEKSRDVYLRQGFKFVQEIHIGRGTHASSGAREPGGPGIMTWAMIWRPDFWSGADLKVSP